MRSGSVWITGAAGFIGRALAARLAQSGTRVIGLGHGAWPDAAEGGVSRWLTGDISAENLGQLAHDEGVPACVFHLAGGASVGAAIAAPREDFERTVDATASLCDWLRLEAPETHLLAASSAAVYGAGHEDAITEDAATRPYSPYGYHKLMMEQVCRSYAETYGLPVIVARLFSVYGAGLRKQLLWDISTRLAEGQDRLRLGGTGAEKRDWTDVRDIARALELLAPLAAPAAPTVNVGTGRGVDVATIARTLVSSWGADVDTEFSGAGRPGDPVSLVANSGRLDSLGFRWSIPVERGVMDYVAWRKGGL